MIKKIVLLTIIFICSFSYAFQKSVLNNGMVVIKEKQSNSQVVSVQLFIKTGSNNEQDSQWGMTHVLEHLVFKGTRTRLPGQIAKEVQQMGGNINAFTSYAVTSYYITLPKQHLAQALDILFDMAFFPTISAEELEKEKPVIVEEINMKSDQPSSIAFEQMMSYAYPNNRVGKRVIGTARHVQSFTSKGLKKYHEAFYKSNNSILVVCGNYSDDALDKKLKSVSGELKPGELYVKDVSGVSTQQEPKLVVTLKKDISQSHFYLGFRIPSYTSLDTPALDVLSTMLGSGSSSRLYKRLKEQKQIVNSISCGIFTGNHPGMLVVAGTMTASQDIKEVISEISDVFSEFKKEGPRQKEFKKVLNNLRASKVYGLEETEELGRELGYFELLSSVEDKEIYERALAKLDKNDLVDVAKKYLVGNRLTLSLCLPETKKISSNNIKEQLNIFAEKKNSLSDVNSMKAKMQEFYLKSGAKVLLLEDNSLPFVSFGAFWPSPFAYETKVNNGITGYSLSLATKATRSMHREQFSAFLEENAITFYPSVDKNVFSLRGKCLSDKLEDLMRVFNDVVSNPFFVKEDYLKENKNLLENIKLRKDNAKGYANYLAEKKLYGSHYYALPISGEISSIEKISLSAIRDWYKHNVSDVLPTLVFSGDIKREQIEQMLSLNGKLAKSVDKPIEYPNEKILEYEKLKKEQHTLLIKYPSPPVGSNDFYAMKVLNSVLSGMGSRLFDSLRNKSNLVYSTYAYMESGIPSGAFSIYAGVKPGAYQKASSLVKEVVHSVVVDKISNSELQKAKSVINGGFLSFMQKKDNIVTNYGRFEILGMGWQAVDVYLEQINAVTVDDVQKVAEKYFSKPYVEIVVGP